MWRSLPPLRSPRGQTLAGAGQPDMHFGVYDRIRMCLCMGHVHASICSFVGSFLRSQVHIYTHACVHTTCMYACTRCMDGQLEGWMDGCGWRDGWMDLRLKQNEQAGMHACMYVSMSWMIWQSSCVDFSATSFSPGALPSLTTGTSADDSPVRSPLRSPSASHLADAGRRGWLEVCGVGEV